MPRKREENKEQDCGPGEGNREGSGIFLERQHSLMRFPSLPRREVAHALLFVYFVLHITISFLYLEHSRIHIKPMVNGDQRVKRRVLKDWPSRGGPTVCISLYLQSYEKRKERKNAKRSACILLPSRCHCFLIITTTVTTTNSLPYPLTFQHRSLHLPKWPADIYSRGNSLVQTPCAGSSE